MAQVLRNTARVSVHNFRARIAVEKTKLRNLRQFSQMSKTNMRTLLLTESSPDPFSCSLPANGVVGSTSRRVVVVCAWCNSRRYASSCSIEVKMLDFLDDKSFRVGTILGCDTCECHARDED